MLATAAAAGLARLLLLGARQHGRTTRRAELRGELGGEELLLFVRHRRSRSSPADTLPARRAPGQVANNGFREIVEHRRRVSPGGRQSGSLNTAPHNCAREIRHMSTFQELLESAFGDHFISVVIAALVAYFVAGVIVFQWPSPFAARVGGSTAWMKKQAAKRAAGEAEEEETFPDPMHKGDLTVEELRRYDGSNPDLPVLVAAKGKVYDMTRGRDYYGKGGPYNCFAGIDCSRALAKVSLDPKDLNGNVSDLYASERDVLNDWVAKFESKYPYVGELLDGDYNGK